jgi:hypothetical protein
VATRDRLERVARAIAARKMGLSNRGERLPDELWRQALPDARAAVAAYRHRLCVECGKYYADPPSKL